MRTKVSIFCDKVIEAGWLAAVVVVPLFFNIYSQRVFEPDKLSLLRSIALVMSVAWVIRFVEDRRSGGNEKAGESEDLSFWQRVYKTPLVLPTLLLVLVYLVSTVTSVVPRVSLLGSYQRLQGTYTTLSYIVIFFLMLGGLRTKRQLNRLVTVMVVVSFPIAMYGLIQHFGLDPLPWGGNVTTRVASNMGNAIFVAAYLIMIVPLTLSRLIENWAEVTSDLDKLNTALAIGLPLAFAILAGLSWILELFFPPASAKYFWLGLLASLIFVLAMAAFAYYLRKPVSRLLLLAAYFVILIAQVACIFYTQSRGPLLGFLGGVFVYFALLGLIKKRVWLPWLMSGVALVAIVFLVMFNTVDSPLMDTLRETPYVGRLGKVLQTEEGTGKVRVLIWEGATNMIDWHEPLEFPGEDGGPDSLNALRPLIGYGPEAMYVAYNRFYPPDLAHYEKRNASPDRSHNETFDALVITGGIGFIVYMLVFTSVFYYGLKWLGLIGNRRQTLAFLGLWIVGGIVGAIGAWAWRGPVYVGVGIPGGVMLGLAAYVFIAVARATFMPGERQVLGGQYALWMLALFAAVVAHFIEIHFGIAIAATRTYFWIFAAMMVVIGIRLGIQHLEADAEVVETVSSVPERVPTVPESAPAPRRRRRRTPTPTPQSRPQVVRGRASDWPGSLLVLSIVAILILGTMLFDFTTIQQGDPGIILTIWRSLTVLRGDPALPVMLALFVVTWTMIGLVGLSDLATRRESVGKKPGEWLTGVGIFAVITFGGVLFFALLHATRLRPVTITSADAPNPLANTITFYYVFVFVIVLALASVLTFMFRRRVKVWQWTGELGDIGVVALAMVLPLIVVVLIFASNVSIVRADILYKQGLSSEKGKQWDGALYFYDKTIDIAKEQDFYYLFLGRAYMEKGKASKAEEREAWLKESEKALLKARELAPLNTDHSANLARLYRTWGGLSQGQKQTEYLNRALSYYKDATSLSPHNAQLCNEWGQTYYALGEREQALAKYQESLALDSEYVQTYILLGEFYMRQKEWDKAIEAYRTATEVAPGSVEAHSSLAYALTQNGDLEGALAAYQRAVELRPKNFNNHKNLAVLYQQMGLTEDAIREATEALNLAPKNQKQQMQNFLAQLQQAQSTPSPEDAAKIQQLNEEGRAEMEAENWDAAEVAYTQIVALDPNNPQAHSALAYIYAKQGRLDDAIAENLTVINLVPNDHNSHKNLALLYQQKGEIAQAISEVEQALALAPEKDKETLQAYLGQLKQLQGEASPTAAPAQRAGDLAPHRRNVMYSAPPPMTIDPTQSYQATIVTEKGNIVVDLAAADAPQTVNNFVYLAREGFYDLLTFHRVENNPGFSLIQGGDPTGTGSGGPGYTIPAEIGLPHDTGAIATARTGDQVNPERASSGSQFYICLEPISQLDGAYTVFGYVVEGLDVAKEIAVGDEILTIVIKEQ